MDWDIYILTLTLNHYTMCNYTVPITMYVLANLFILLFYLIQLIRYLCVRHYTCHTLNEFLFEDMDSGGINAPSVLWIIITGMLLAFLLFPIVFNIIQYYLR